MTAPSQQGVPSKKIHGVRLSQYAGICAALGCGFPLSEALENDALDTRRWRRAAPAWAAKLSREKPGSPLRGAFDQKLEEAVAWLGRRIEPIEADLESWAAFLGALSSDPAPGALLSKLGLRTDDVARIQQRWSKRAASDPSLRQRMIKLTDRRAKALPSLRITPATLRPFPWSDRSAGPAREVAPREAPVESAELPQTEISILTPSFMLSGQGVSYPLGGLSAGLFSGRGAALTPVLPSQTAGPVASPEAPSNTPLSTGTALVFELPRLPVMPFSVKADSPAESGRRAESTAVGGGGPAPRMGETALVFELPKLAVIPFRPATAESPAEATPPAERPNWLSAPRAETALAFELPRSAPLPFAKPATPAPSQVAAKPEGSAAPRAKQGGAPIGETIASFELPASMVLPFLGAERDKPPPPPKTADPAPAPPAAPPASPAPAEAAPATAPVAPPRGQESPPAAAPGAPSLTLEQHASLAAELAMYPDRAADTLLCYRVTPESKRRLDRHYADLGVARPDIRAAWDRAYRTYYQWLMTQPRRRA